MICFEGLVHISELASHHVENPREVVSQGDVLSVRIIEIDPDRRRLSLSLKRVADIEGGEAPLEDDAAETDDVIDEIVVVDDAGVIEDIVDVADVSELEDEAVEATAVIEQSDSADETPEADAVPADSEAVATPAEDTEA